MSHFIQLGARHFNTALLYLGHITHAQTSLQLKILFSFFFFVEMTNFRYLFYDFKFSAVL